MKTKRLVTGALAIALCLSASSYRTQAQETAARKAKGQTFAPAAGSNPVVGSGSAGHITRWTGVEGANTYVVGNSNIFQDKFGKVGIGTTTPTSLLTVQGMIEITIGGLKFPDGTLQTTAFNTSQVVRSLNGLTGDVTLAGSGAISVTPSGNTLIISAPGALTGVTHDATLTGDGTQALPLGVAIPLVLSGSVVQEISGGVIEVTNTATSGRGIKATGGPSGIAVFATGGNSFSPSGFGAVGVAAFGGMSESGTGGIGVRAFGGISQSGTGGVGVVASGGSASGAGNIGGIGIDASGGVGDQGEGLAGRFQGNVQVTGTLSKGGGSFKIDHPLDPENKYLYHSFVESPDMKNIYDGNVVTDANGEAFVVMPEYFEALNRDFRYQLTVIGQFAQAIVAEKIKGNRFVIKTNSPNVEVSWQVTGIRQDAFANRNRIPVEEAKPDNERGYFLHPEAFNLPEEKSTNWSRDPEKMKQRKQRRVEAERTQK